MSIAKTVSFVEKIDKTSLGLKGLQIVVYCDRSREIDLDKSEIKDEQYDFYKIGKEIINSVDGEYIKEKYGLQPGIEFGRKLHEERVKWLKNNLEGDVSNE